MLDRRALRAGSLGAVLAMVAPSAGQASPPAAAAGVRAHAAAPERIAAYALQVRGRLVEAWHGDAPRQPASLAKLALALAVAAQDGGRIDPERVVSVSPRAAAMPAARLGLRAGERVRAADLLRALLVASSNDACIALAEQFPGGVAGAVAAMNRLAASLDMRSTRFADPCGFDHPSQSTTARDLLRLADASLAHPDVAAAAAERSVTVRTVDAGRAISANSSNALLLRQGSVNGLKTGRTRGAGACLILSAQEADARVVIVLLGAQDRWESAERLLERGLHLAFAGPR